MLRTFLIVGVGLLVNFSCLLNALSADSNHRGRPEEPAYEGTLSGSIGELLFKGFPFAGGPKADRDLAPGRAKPASSPALMDRGQMESALNSSNSVASVGNLPSMPEKKYWFLEIEVSHSAHTFKLCGISPAGKREILYECRIGLGSSEFPTPVGTYFVTHIYDDNPWWIPPKDRAWAAGDSPSKRVYGGTMAPLLKKRPLSLGRKKQQPDFEDLIEGPMKFDDYGYRFHGTNAPRSIGHNQSHGCVRMIPDDARKVATLIKEFVGEADRRESENGTFVILSAPVRLNLIK